LVGMRGPGMEFKEIYDTMLKPTRGLGKAWTAGMNRLGAAVKMPSVPVRSDALRAAAGQLSRLIWKFNLSVNRALIQYREPVMDMQLVQERIAGVAMEMFASACVISRLDAEIQGVARNGEADASNREAGELFLRQSSRRMRRLLADLNDNDDRDLLATANVVLGKQGAANLNGR
ncbi:MAG: acyl-CoA dehydrogenase, partial [Chthoniobacterales bacterium]